MNIIEHLQRLDALIIEHTKPPVTPILRRELSFAIEQCEAYLAASEKQDHTLATQIETIERLVKRDQDRELSLQQVISENTKLVSENTKLKQEAASYKVKPDSNKVIHATLCLQSKQPSVNADLP